MITDRDLFATDASIAYDAAHFAACRAVNAIFTASRLVDEAAREMFAATMEAAYVYAMKD